MTPQRSPSRWTARGSPDAWTHGMVSSRPCRHTRAKYLTGTTCVLAVLPVCPGSARRTLQDSNVSVLLNNELSKIHLWLSVNKLTLNIEKTKFMVFHPYQKDISKLMPSLIIKGIELESVDHIACLGVILDENMSWKPHLDMLANKISKYTGIMNKLKQYLYTPRTLYFSMMNSNLNYGILVWGFSCQRLIKLQKKVIRIISRSKYNAHTEPIFKTLDILTLDDLFNLNALKLYYKYIRNTLPPYFYSFNIVTQGSIHEHMTRQRDLIRTRPRTFFCRETTKSLPTKTSK